VETIATPKPCGSSYDVSKGKPVWMRNISLQGEAGIAWDSLRVDWRQFHKASTYPGSGSVSSRYTCKYKRGTLLFQKTSEQGSLYIFQGGVYYLDGVEHVMPGLTLTKRFAEDTKRQSSLLGKAWRGAASYLPGEGSAYPYNVRLYIIARRAPVKVHDNYVMADDTWLAAIRSLELSQGDISGQRVDTLAMELGEPEFVGSQEKLRKLKEQEVKELLQELGNVKQVM
jgi:hypothetical protein